MITHMYGLAVYVKVELPFALENNFDSYLCFQQTLLYSLPYFFFLYQSPLLYLCMAFDIVLSNIDGFFSSINTFTNVFMFGDLNVHHKD